MVILPLYRSVYNFLDHLKFHIHKFIYTGIDCLKMVHKYDGLLQSSLRQLTYSQPDLVRNDINNMCHHFKELKPATDTYVFNNGMQKKLIKIIGTIPVTYRQNLYNIPIIIWISENHPQSPPMCFVNPTATMLIRAGKHVDNTGKIYLPYISEWRQGTHDLTSLVQVMTVVFGEQPPVYSKQGGNAAQPPPPQPAARTPYPPQIPPTGAMPYPSTPYPHTEGPPSTSYQPNMPYPNSTPYPTPYPPTNSYPTPNANYPGYPPQSQSAPYPPPVPNTAAQSKPSALNDETIKASLMSAVNDKLKRRMKDAFAQAELEMTTLKQTENELKSGQEKIDRIVEKLQEETQEVEKNINLLTERNKEIQEKLEQFNDQQDDLNIDEVVSPTTPLYKQIVNSFAQEQAIEDTIYYLGEALRKGVLDLDVFLKHVRDLSREQFMLRATIKTARETAGLVDI